MFMKKIFLAVALAVCLIYGCKNSTKNETIVPLEQKVEPRDLKTTQKSNKVSSGLTNSTTTFYAATTENDQNGIANYKTDSIGNRPTPNVAEPVKPKATNTPAATKTYEDWDKKIIKTANVKLELADYNKYNLALHNQLKRFGAYIANEEQNLSDYKTENTVCIKVPVENFEELVNSIGGEAVKVLEKKISSEDVTGEVVDTKARVEAKKAVRQQYLDLLKQAKNMTDILEVQSQINTIQEDIESAGGRVNYLTHQAAYSTININYFQYADGGEKQISNSNGFGGKLKNAFAVGGSIITGLIVVVVSVWPLLVVFGIILWLWKRRKNNSKPSQN